MPTLRRLGRQLSSVLWGTSVEEEVADELDFHLEMRTRELIERGMEPAAARAAALARFGDIGAVGAACRAIGRQRERDMRRTEYWSELLQDSRFALRQLRLSPGFAAVAVLTLALGVGATTAIFSAVEAVVLRPFAFANPERLTLVMEHWPAMDMDGNVSVGNFADWRRRSRSFEQLAAINFRSFNLLQGESPERVLGGEVTWNFFPALNVRPLAGRVFTPDEDQPGHAQVVVLGYSLWRRSFAADRRAVGRTVRLNSRPYTIVGVMPADFDPTASAEQLWVPAAFSPERLAMHDEHFLNVIGLLRKGVTARQAQQEMDAIARRMSEEYPATNKATGVRIRSLPDFILGPYRARLFVLLGAVLCVLLIACGNVANLLLARGAARAKEVAVRSAIGAGRGRLTRQLLTESLVLSLLATVAGLLFAWQGIHLLVGLAPADIPRLAETRVDGVVLAFALAVAVLSSLLFGALPAVRGSRADLNAALKEGGRTATAGTRDSLRGGLIAAEVGIALVLLIGAGLLIQSAVHLSRVDPGFDLHGVLTARVALPPADAERTAVETEQTFERIVAALAARPGVRQAAATSQAPMGPGGTSNGLLPEGRSPDPTNLVQSQLRMVTPGYFATLRIPLLRGRLLTAADVAGQPRVMVVSAALAKAAWPHEDAVGKRVGCCEGSPADPRFKTVVGVVGDVRSGGPAQEVTPEFYLPIAQVPAVAWGWSQRTMTVVVRGAAGDAAALAPVIRAVVREIDPTVPVYSLATMEQQLGKSLAEDRFHMLLLAVLGVVGLLLAAAGIYSVIAYFASLRSHEIGVRMALGATAADILGLMAWQGLRPVLAGTALGSVAAWWAARLLAGALHGVRPTDPATFAVTAGLLVAVGLAASWIPARRAAAGDPSRVLHG